MKWARKLFLSYGKETLTTTMKISMIFMIHMYPDIRAGSEKHALDAQDTRHGNGVPCFACHQGVRSPPPPLHFPFPFSSTHQLSLLFEQGGFRTGLLHAHEIMWTATLLTSVQITYHDTVGEGSNCRITWH